MGHDVKSIRAQFRANGVFYSSTALAELLKSLMPSDAEEVYDPTCGDGSLLAVFPDTVRKFGQELDGKQAQLAQGRLVNAEIAVGDTLTAPAFLNKRFRAIVANPPFSIKWTPPEDADENPVFRGVPCMPPPSRADYAFLLHVVHCLADGGVAAVVNFPGVCYRGQREGKLRRWMIERNLIEGVIQLEQGKYFVDTKVATVILILRKDRTKTSIRIRDNSLGQERKVPLHEIEENDYSLNVGNYIHALEPEKPKVNPWELENVARSHALSKIRAEIQFSMMVAQMEGWSIEPFLDDIHKVVNEFRQSPTLF